MKLTLLEFSDEDFEMGKQIAARAGRTDSAWVYTTTSAIIGMEYLDFANGYYQFNKFAIIKTEELGFLLIKDLSDLNSTDLIK